MHSLGRLSFAATLVASALAFLAAPSTAGATPIVNRHWGGTMCLDADPRENFDGGQVYVWECNGYPNQQWDMWSDGTIHSRWNGRCLDADPRTNTNGGRVYLWTCITPPPPQQRWYRWPNGEITSTLTGRCLDAEVSGGGNPTKLQMWDCWGWENGRWRLDPEVVCTGEATKPACGPPSPSGPGNPGNPGTPGTPGTPGGPPAPPSSPGPPAPPPPESCQPARSATSEFALRAKVGASRGRSRRALTVGYGRRLRVSGRLARKSGAPVVGARICVVTKRSVAGAARRPRAVVMTGEGGRFSYDLRSGPSQRLWFVYRAGGAAASVRVRVRAPLKLEASPHTVRSGETVTIRGRVRGRPVPKGALVLLQARRPGRWQPFRDTRVGRNGRFGFKYEFLGSGGVYQLRARMPAHKGSAFATSTSNVVRVRVG